MAERPPISRRAAAAMIRNAEGNRTSAPPESSANEEPAKSDPGPPPAAPTAATPDKPRFGSLVEYPDEPAEPTSAPLVGEELDRKLDTIAAEPGVYLLRDRAGKVLYVGKAKSLRSRVRAYFRDAGDTRFQVRFLMKRVRDFDTLVASSEKEALILENNLIKQYRPRYNIRLKDDKSYLSAKITNHPWPRITVT